MTISPNGFWHLSLPHSWFLGGIQNIQNLPLNVRERGSFVGCIQKVSLVNLMEIKMTKFFVWNDNNILQYYLIRTPFTIKLFSSQKRFNAKSILDYHWIHVNVSDGGTFFIDTERGFRFSFKLKAYSQLK